MTPNRPVVRVDETSKQLIIETRTPIPAKPGQPRRVDYEYKRNGVEPRGLPDTANLFMMFAPLEGWRDVRVTDQRAAVDYAQVLNRAIAYEIVQANLLCSLPFGRGKFDQSCRKLTAPTLLGRRKFHMRLPWVLKELSDTHFPQTSKIVLVQDNLSAQTPALLYAAFLATDARRLVERFEWHYTPKHGSWLDMAESELSVLSCQCLSRRIADKDTLTKEVAAWQQCLRKQAMKRDIDGYISQAHRADEVISLGCRVVKGSTTLTGDGLHLTRDANRFHTDANDTGDQRDDVLLNSGETVRVERRFEDWVFGLSLLVLVEHPLEGRSIAKFVVRSLFRKNFEARYRCPRQPSP